MSSSRDLSPSGILSQFGERTIAAEGGRDKFRSSFGMNNNNNYNDQNCLKQEHSCTERVELGVVVVVFWSRSVDIDDDFDDNKQWVSTVDSLHDLRMINDWWSRQKRKLILFCTFGFLWAVFNYSTVKLHQSASLSELCLMVKLPIKKKYYKIAHRMASYMPYW